MTILQETDTNEICNSNCITQVDCKNMWSLVQYSSYMALTSYKSLEVIKPPKEIRLKFDNKVIPMFEKIKINSKQIQTLENLRDTLLPKLLRGEVRVEK